jgi:hypothetical protein
MSATGLLDNGCGSGMFARGDRSFPGLVLPDDAVIDVSDRSRTRQLGANARCPTAGAPTKGGSFPMLQSRPITTL